MINKNKYDLVIVGGGLVGASLLLALKDSGLKIALIEAQEYKSRTVAELDQRSLVLSLGSKLFFEGLGIWKNIARYTTRISEIKISEQGCFNKAFLKNTSLGVDALGYVININSLNKALWDKIESNNNVDILCPYKLLDLKFSKDGKNSSELILEDLDNNNKIIEANIVIAADGGRSYVRDLLNIPVDKHDYKQSALIANVEHQLENNNVAFERFSEQGPFAILPRENKNISGIVWPWPSDKQDYIKNLSDQELLKKLNNLFGYKLGKFTKIGTRQFFPLWKIYSKELFKNRVIFLGNAANHIHPVGGQGFNLGLRDVKYFSRILLENKDILLNTNFSLESVTDVFSQYSDVRYDDHYNLRSNTHNLLELFDSNKYIIKNLRRLGLTVLNHSYLLRSIVADHSMGLSA